MLGPRIFRIFPDGVLMAVSALIISLQSESIVTQTNGKLSKCHANAEVSTFFSVPASSAYS